MSEEYDLNKSAKKLGKLCPILKDAHGNIIDGFHRQNTDPNWPTIDVMTIGSPKELELARLTVNFCRRKVPSGEIENKLVFLVDKCGMKPEEISEVTGISLPTIYRHLPQELKDSKKVEAGKIGGEVSGAIKREQTVKTQDITQLVSCEFCKIATGNPVERVINNKPRRLCDKHAGQYDVNPLPFQAHFRNFNGETKASQEKTVEQREIKPAQIETWEQRKAQMSPQHSKMEDAVIARLHDLGVSNIVQDHEFCVQTTIPDIWFPALKTVIYIDGPVHNGKQEPDNKLREKLNRHHGLRVLSYSYENFSPKEAEQIAKQIAAALGEEKEKAKTEGV
jgi:very-short-patch-repair endonuclease